MSIERNSASVLPDQPDLPQPLVDSARQGLVRYRERCGGDCDWLEQRLQAPDFASQLARVWGCSPFVVDSCVQHPQMFRDLLESGDLESRYSPDTYRQRLSAALQGATAEAELQRQLRQFRRREMVRILWRDFTRSAALLDTTGDMTRLAEACIQCALDILHPQLCDAFGTPMGKLSGQPQQLVVLGMGKMGAWELNVSSDIDLIFAFPEGGETAGGKRQISNQEFFTKLGQKLIQCLDNNTVDGFVFRVDMRLRPYGQSGSLALNFDAMEEYYQTQGRDWERYAMVKARVVAGDQAAGKKLMAILRPFTYRKYIDFSAIQSLRDMKALINREVKRLGMNADIKKGAGGIREVEFIAQAFQLIRGGKDSRFQNAELKEILPLLDSEGLLPTGVSAQLWQAYEFLRNCEHAIQGHKDQQTQLLPQSEPACTALATVMGFDSWEDFLAQLDQHRELVRGVFDDIASVPVEDRESPPQVQSARHLWLAADKPDSLGADLADLGYANGDEMAQALLSLRNSRAVKALEAGVRTRLDTFMPLLIAACAEGPGGSATLARILPLVQGIVRRSAYLVLLIENPNALRQLVRLCGESVWIAEQIERYPALLDELLDPRTLYTPADKASLAQDLRQQVLRIAPEDLEAQMEALRYFHLAQGLRVAACEVDGALPLMKVSDNLTWLAEVILDHVLTLSWEWMVSRHGHPGKDGEQAAEPGILVLGYGKLGGIELGHGSDLDLVFIHNANPNLSTDGDKPIDNATFFMRLGQRIIHILTAQTVSGVLYEVDMRLRPNGNSGMLVTSLSAYEKYQRDNAWTWEHQALVRARPVAGNSAIASAFEDIRRAVLCTQREDEELRREVTQMREKMRTHLGSAGADKGAGSFQLKQDAGGIVDIEFVVQYLVLRHAARYPAWLAYTDNMRLLDAIGASDLLSAEAVGKLQAAYIFFRSLLHRLNLQGLSAVIGSGSGDWQEACHHREQVRAIWEEVF
ncbi:MAG: hypothetical protein VR73_10700 [Gammaproteobacteria bacterium BRH_c0]|nr:MAG: hypothetical protein VR73_10700 [Gammaproteobacteria bacterium BRH_c0]